MDRGSGFQPRSHYWNKSDLWLEAAPTMMISWVGIFYQT